MNIWERMIPAVPILVQTDTKRGVCRRMKMGKSERISRAGSEENGHYFSIAPKSILTSQPQNCCGSEQPTAWQPTAAHEHR